NAVILNRLGSYLAVGPEPGSSDLQTAIGQAAAPFYAGWLIGPQGSGARIEWDAGDQNGDYIEVIEGKLAISANVTVKKTLGLIYEVWFVNGPRVTIDAAADSVTIGGKKGLFANGGTYKFYGTKSVSGGVNTPSATASIVIKSGSVLEKEFLTSGTAGDGQYIEPQGIDPQIVVTNAGNVAGAVSHTYPGTSIVGYDKWEDLNTNTVF
ncbi:MAG: hypothetical protein LBH51_04735, partial [Treponema sp.]|nr:hypothetical protein [Treponema sp.]